MSLKMSNDTVKLPFRPPVFEEDAMKVDEIDFSAVNCGSMPFRASRFEVYPGKKSPPDQHEVTECWFIAKGIGELEHDGQNRTNVKAGDVLYFNSYQSHTINNTGEDNLIIYSIWWKD